jgi:hypothetical protein
MKAVTPQFHKLALAFLLATALLGMWPRVSAAQDADAAYDKEQYLKHSIPRIEGPISFDDLVATRNGDIVVTRMRLKIRERLDGRQAESGAPQLIVFRVTPQGWQVVASANFAKLQN